MKRCICVYQRTSRTTWALRVIHPKCPRHGNGTTWRAVPDAMEPLFTAEETT